MYSQFDAVRIALTAVAAPDGAVARDRKRFAPFLAAAEQYISRQGLIVGGDVARLMLEGRPPGVEGHVYEIYSARPSADAHRLSEIFYDLDPGGMGYFVSATSAGGGSRQEFTVNVDERPLVRVCNPPDPRRPLARVVNTEPRPALYAQAPTKLNCLPPEVLLAGVYASLTNPARAGDWPKLLESEESLRRQLPAEFARRGGGEPHGRKDADRQDPQDAKALVSALLRDYASGAGRVVVGGHALGAAESRLQVVSEFAFAAEKEKIRRIAAAEGLNVQTTEDDPGFVAEPRLRRLTVYLVTPGARRRAVLDVYNAAQYELVPSVLCGALCGALEYTGGRAAPKAKGPASPKRAAKHRVGTPFVLMRFLLVDVWVLALLREKQLLAPAAYARARGRLASLYARAAGLYAAGLRAERYGDLAPADGPSYVGRYENPVVHQKRELFGSGKKRAFRPPYYPAAA